jgi:hypothetical protein
MKWRLASWDSVHFFILDYKLYFLIVLYSIGVCLAFLVIVMIGNYYISILPMTQPKTGVHYSSF